MQDYKNFPWITFTDGLMMILGKPRLGLDRKIGFFFRVGLGLDR